MPSRRSQPARIAFALDRLSEPATTGRRVPRRDVPTGDAATYLAQALANAAYGYTVHAAVQAPAETILARCHVLPDRIQRLDEHTCTINVSDDSLDYIAHHLVELDAEFAIDDGPPEIRDRLRKLADRLTRAARS
jgi:hypothetical protein